MNGSTTTAGGHQVGLTQLGSLDAGSQQHLIRLLPFLMGSPVLMLAHQGNLLSGIYSTLRQQTGGFLGVRGIFSLMPNNTPAHMGLLGSKSKQSLVGHSGLGDQDAPFPYPSPFPSPLLPTSIPPCCHPSTAQFSTHVHKWPNSWMQHWGSNTGHRTVLFVLCLMRLTMQS